MNKYEDGLKTLLHEINFPSKECDVHFGEAMRQIAKAEKDLQELVDKEIEQESRKDKLIVGSQWECIAENRGRNTVFKKGIETYILEIEENFITFGHGTVYGYVRDSAPIDQFLLCFKPKGENE